MVAKEENAQEMLRRESLITHLLFKYMQMTGQLRIISHMVPWLATVFRAQHAQAHCHGQCLHW